VLKTDHIFLKKVSYFGQFQSLYTVAVVSSLFTSYAEANCHAIRCIAIRRNNNILFSTSKGLKICVGHFAGLIIQVSVGPYMWIHFL
jgi:hypothetical protein